MSIRHGHLPIYFSGAITPDSEVSKPQSSTDYRPLDAIEDPEKFQLFGLWLGIVHFHRRDGFMGRLRWKDARRQGSELVRDFERSYAKGDRQRLNRGLTLEEMTYACEAISRKRWMCLVSTSVPPQPLDRIDHKKRVSPHDMADFAASYCKHRPGHCVMALAYDGRFGHCVAVFDADGRLYKFLDPWPGRSLLCEEHNSAGVKATSLGPLRVGEPGEVWQITRKEFENVMVALLVIYREWNLVAAVDLLGTLDGNDASRPDSFD